MSEQNPTRLSRLWPCDVVPSMEKRSSCFNLHTPICATIRSHKYLLVHSREYGVGGMSSSQNAGIVWVRSSYAVNPADGRGTAFNSCPCPG